MAEDRPNVSPQWGEASGASVSTPSTSKRNQGWFENESPAHDFENFMKRMYGQWLKHLGGTVSTFTSLLDACSATGEFPIANGDTCFIDEGYDPGDRFLEPLAAYDPEDYATTSRLIYALCSDGRYIYTVSADPGTLSDPAQIRRISRETGAVDGSWSCTTTAVVTGEDWDLWTDGDILVFGSSDALEVFDVVAGGSPTWTKAPATADRKVWADTVHVYQTRGDDVVAFDRATGTQVWVFDHGAPVWAITSDGTYVYVFGEPSGHASGADLRCINAADGAAATTEGGTSAGTGDEWDLVLAPTPSAGGRGDIALGGGGELFIYYHQGVGTGTAVISSRDPIDGSEQWTSAQMTSHASDFVVAEDRIYGLNRGGRLIALSYDGTEHYGPEPESSGPVRTYTFPTQFCHDGSYLWTGGLIEDNGSTVVATLGKWSVGSKIRHWKRINPANKYALPLQQLIVPA